MDVLTQNLQILEADAGDEMTDHHGDETTIHHVEAQMDQDDAFCWIRYDNVPHMHWLPCDLGSVVEW